MECDLKKKCPTWTTWLTFLKARWSLIVMKQMSFVLSQLEEFSVFLFILDNHREQFWQCIIQQWYICSSWHTGDKWPLQHVCVCVICMISSFFLDIYIYNIWPGFSTMQKKYTHISYTFYCQEEWLNEGYDFFNQKNREVFLFKCK